MTTEANNGSQLAHRRASGTEIVACGDQHAVQFYDDDDFLTERLARFVAAGFESREPVLMVATRAHREACRRRLESRGIDVGRALEAGQLNVLDAHQLLESFMVGRHPDHSRFVAAIDPIVAGVLRSRAGRNVRAFGEMVDLLCRDGLVDAALQLEGYWNELLEGQPIDRLCSYSLASFEGCSRTSGFDRICEAHSRVSPAEDFAGVRGTDAELREITSLQQRARSLEAEIERRRAVERALRDALAARDEADEARNAALDREHAARHAAEAANGIKDEFLAMLSHELRTPLNAILGWSRMLRGGQLDAAKHERALETIERNARAQARLIEDLLDVSRIVAGNMRIDPRPMNLASVVESAIELVRPVADAKGLRVRFVLEPHGQVVLGDDDRLRQVVCNLVSNAVKFTPAGGAVEVRLAFASPHIVLSVTDDGVGISPDFMPFVFDRFRQAEAGAARAHGGLGLGLAIARNLVELHGGTIHAESRGPGLGARFEVRLPVALLDAT